MGADLKNVLIVCACVYFVFSRSVRATVVFDSSVLLISFDGFRYDFANRNLTPNFLKIKGRGSWADHMKPQFPTKTYPNHHSIVTGLYPEVHGVLANSVFDSDFKSELQFEDPKLYHYNERIEPIWVTNERERRPTSDKEERKAHPRSLSGVMMWPGIQHTFQNKTATFSVPMNRSMPWEERVDSVLGWFTHPKTPINLGLAYFEEPDTQSHLHGPNSREVNETIKRVDALVGYLIEKIDQHNLTRTLNVIIVSDHGSHESKFENLIDISQFVDMQQLSWAGCSPILQIQPKKGKLEEVFSNLTKFTKEKHFKVYRKRQIPEHWRYKKNNRTAELLVLADVGYAFQGRIKNIDEDWKSIYYNQTLKPGQIFGVHGYSNEEISMRPSFFSWGPRIRPGFHLNQTFQNIDIHPLISQMLSIPPLPPHLKANGSLATVAKILREIHPK